MVKDIINNEGAFLNKEFSNKPEKSLSIEAKELVKIITSEEFKKKLKEAADYTKGTGCESMFDIGMARFNNFIKVYFGDVIEGHPESIMDYFGIGLSSEKDKKMAFEYFYEDKKNLKKNPNFILLANFHFHPQEFSKESFICCSASDLLLLEASEEQKAYEFIMIGQIDLKGDYKILLIRKLKDKEMSEERFNMLKEELSGFYNYPSSQDDIIISLRGFGYKTEIIKISKNYQISREDRKKLEKFCQ